MQVEQIDREAAETLFKDVLGNVSSYGEWGYTSYREAAERSMAQAFARHRHQARAEQTAELAKFKALAETLAWALGEAVTWNSHDDEGVAAVWLDQADEALREYKEARDGMA